MLLRLLGEFDLAEEPRIRLLKRGPAATSASLRVAWRSGQSLSERPRSVHRSEDQIRSFVRP